MKQFLFRYVTTPIAKALDFINVPKTMKLKKRRKAIAEENKRQYIETTSKVLFDQEIQEHMAQGEIPNPLFLPLIIDRHITQAIKMFEEKKKAGDFDELNIMIR